MNNKFCENLVQKEKDFTIHYLSCKHLFTYQLPIIAGSSGSSCLLSRAKGGIRHSKEYPSSRSMRNVPLKQTKKEEECKVWVKKKLDTLKRRKYHNLHPQFLFNPYETLSNKHLVSTLIFLKKQHNWWVKRVNFIQFSISGSV